MDSLLYGTWGKLAKYGFGVLENLGRAHQIQTYCSGEQRKSSLYMDLLLLENLGVNLPFMDLLSSKNQG